MTKFILYRSYIKRWGLLVSNIPSKETRETKGSCVRKDSSSSISVTELDMGVLWGGRTGNGAKGKFKLTVFLNRGKSGKKIS